MNLGEAWRSLGITRTPDAGAIRRGYAARLKTLDLDRDAADYADLRTAREIALRWAREQEKRADAPIADGVAGPQEEVDQNEIGEGERAALTAWPYAAPEWPGDVVDPALTVTTADPLAQPYLAVPTPALSGEIRDIPVPVGDPFAVPLAAVAANVRETLVQPDRGRDTALYALLFPGGEPSDDPLDPEETAQAHGHLRALIRQAEQAPLTTHEAIDTWLADTLARAWPRSAPVLGDAVEAFGWKQQAGMLGERHAVAFLNARNKGLRFHEKVLVAGHPLHKAWTELVRPGRASWLHQKRVDRGEVEQLILGVRKNFPELEHFWDGQRVASWEGAAASSSGSNGPGVWIWVVIAIGVVRLLASIGGSSGPEAQAVPEMETADVLRPDRVSLLDEAARDTFGNEMDLGRVAALNPELAKTFRANLPGDSSREAAVFAPNLEPHERFFFKAKMRNLVRDRVYRAAQLTEGEDLIAAMRLRLEYLIAARAIDAEACMDIYRLAKLHDAAQLGASTLESERRLALKLLKNGSLVPPIPATPRKATIPGSMVQSVIDETRLPVATVHQAMDNQGSDAAQCAVQIALLRAALNGRRPEQTSILHVL